MTRSRMDEGRAGNESVRSGSARCVKTRARPRRVNAPRLVLKDVAHVMAFRTRPAGAEPGLKPTGQRGASISKQTKKTIAVAVILLPTERPVPRPRTTPSPRARRP